MIEVPWRRPRPAADLREVLPVARGREQPPSGARHAPPESDVIQLLAATHFFGQSWAGPGDDAMCCACNETVTSGARATPEARQGIRQGGSAGIRPGASCAISCGSEVSKASARSGRTFFEWIRR